MCRRVPVRSTQHVYGLNVQGGVVLTLLRCLYVGDSPFCVASMLEAAPSANRSRISSRAAAWAAGLQLAPDTAWGLTVGKHKDRPEFVNSST